MMISSLSFYILLIPFDYEVHKMFAKSFSLCY